MRGSCSDKTFGSQSSPDAARGQGSGISKILKILKRGSIHPGLEVDENSVLVLKNVGPRGYPGMPEVGNMGIPSKLLEKGIRDMVRISDGRMSGTGFGTIVLHVSPEAAVGGKFSFIEIR